MQTSVRIIGAVTEDGMAPPINADQEQVAVSPEGFLYVTLSMSPGFPLFGESNNSSHAPSVDPVNVPAVCFTYIFDENSGEWERLTVQTTGVSNFAPDSLFAGSAIRTQSTNWVYNLAADRFDRAEGAANNANLAASANVANIQSVSFNYGLGGDDATFSRFRVSDATQLAKLSSDGAQIVERPGNWAINDAPAVGVQATVTRAAGAAGVRHICDSICFTLNAVGAIAAPVQVNLRDGASGAGTILRTWRLTVPAGETLAFSETGLNIVGSAATAMTLEFAAAPAGTDFQTVNLSGHDASG